MFQLSFSIRRKSLDRNGNCLIYIRIMKERKSVYVNSGAKIKPEDWNNKRQRVKSSNPDADLINTLIEKVYLEVKRKGLALYIKNPDVTVQQIKAAYEGKADKFFPYARKFIEHYKKNQQTRSYFRYRTALNKLEEFKSNLTFKDITPSFLKDYERHLKEVVNNKPNTIHSHVRCIRRILNEYVDDGMMSAEDNPFLKYKIIKRAKTEKAFLTEEELELLTEYDLKDSVKYQLYIDAYLFSSYCGGLRFSDVALLKTEVFDGEKLTILTKKTKSYVSLKVPKKALAIIEKYYVPTNRFVFPILSEEIDLTDNFEVDRMISSKNAYANKTLKVISKRAGITKHISFHTSRVNFITMALRLKIPIHIVAALVGHSKLSTTMIYTRLVNKDLDDAMSAFDE